MNLGSHIYPINLWIEDGVYHAECPDIEGTLVVGNTEEEAIENCKDSIYGVLKYYSDN